MLSELRDFSSLSIFRDRAFVALEQALLTIDGDDVGFDPKLMLGLQADSPLWAISGLGGAWPRAAWLATTESRGHSGIVHFYRWRTERWTREETMPEGQALVGMVPWLGDSTLALMQESLALGAKFKLLSGRPGAVVPELTRSKPRSSACPVKLRAEVLTALPSGHLFVAGPTCAARGSEWELVGGAVERWAPGERRGTLEALPELGAGRAITLSGMAAVSADEVYVAGELEPSPGPARPYFARFDGSSWTSLSSPIPGFVERLWAERGGALWMSDTSGRLFRRPAGGAITEVELPSAITGVGADSRPSTLGLWLRAPGDVWAVVRRGEKTFLLHTRPSTKPVSSPPTER